jgi:hypothetical protein
MTEEVCSTSVRARTGCDGESRLPALQMESLDIGHIEGEVCACAPVDQASARALIAGDHALYGER